MADCNDTLEGWEWESIFASSLFEQDTSIIAWQGDFCEPELTVVVAPDAAATVEVAQGAAAHILSHPSSASSFPSPHLPDTITSPKPLRKSGNRGDSSSTPLPTTALNVANTSDGSLESSDHNHDAPVTSHHLPSETSLNNPLPVVFTKKKKRDPRLVCPNFLAGRVPCSCPEEDELEEDAEVEDVVKKRPKLAARCQVPSCGGDLSHLKGYHQRHRVCLGCANSPEVILKDQPHRYCQQCGKFHRLSDFDEGKRSCRRKLEKHNRRRRRQPLEKGEAQDSGFLVPGIENDHNNMQSSIDASAAQEEWNTAASTKQSSDIHPASSHRKRVVGSTQDLENLDLHASDDSSASVLRFEQELMSSNKSELDEQSWLMMLMDDATEGAEPSTSQRRQTEYVSPCPTGRVSFKLYDWNPANFPRRLRQQIFEWLANMPLELEGYIRSGCIILTFFISMPQVMWDKIMDDWTGQVQKLVLQPGTQLWGTGQIIARMNEKSVYVRNGKVVSADHRERLAPFLVGLYPLSLEAGCHTHIYVSGFNFCGARFLVSFGEQYLECSDCEPIDCQHFTHRTIWKSIGNLEIRKVTVFLPDSQKFGPAYVEVDSDHGVSNFMPVLVADKDVCVEINAFKFGSVLSAEANHDANPRHGKAEFLRPQCGVDILTDLGWALRYMNGDGFVDKTEARKALTKRLHRLLIFSLEHDWTVVVKRLVQTALTTGIFQNMGVLSAGSGGQHTLNVMETLMDVKDVLISKGLWEADNICSVDSSSQLKGIEGAKSTATKQKQLCLALMSSQSKEVDNMVPAPAKDSTVMEVPLLEERIPILEDGLKQKGGWLQPLGWSRKPTRNLASSTLCTSKRRLRRIVVIAVSIVTICTGMCFMLQHPHEVAEISMSLRRCLWGTTNTLHA